MKNLMSKLRRRGNHERPEYREYWRPKDAELRMPYRGNSRTLLDIYEFDQYLMRLDATVKGRGPQ